MTAKLHLSPDLTLPLDAVTQTFAILAMRGVGKTHTASVFAEELSEAGLPFVVLDPTGAWWGLRASADGKGTGYPVTILGGDHGDVPLEEGGGKLIADLVAEKAPSLILDLSLLSKSAMRRFVADFAEELYRKNRTPLHLLIDEADSFAPQRPRPDEMRMLGALDEIVRRGRIRGLGCTLVTQRSAVLNKDVLTQTEALVVLRTAHPRDRAPVLEWMRVHATPEQLKAVEESLAKLPKGDAWVMSAGWLDLFARVHIRERKTFNSSATPTPGQVRASPRQLAPVDLKELQARMAETIERAKASDPALLRQRIAELEAEARKRQAAALPVPVAKERRVEVPVISPADFVRLESAISALRAQGQELFDAANQLEVALKLPRPSKLSVATPSAKPAFLFNHVPSTGIVHTSAGVEVVPNGARRMLQCLAQRHPLKLTRSQLGTLSGFTPSGGTFGNYFGLLKRLGYLVESANGDVAIMPTGLNYVGGDVPPAPTTTSEILALWRERLPAGAARMLDLLADLYPRDTTRQDLGEQSGFTASGGTFGNYLGLLRRNGLVDIDRNRVRASATLFIGQ